MHFLGKTLLAFALLHLYSKATFACYSRYLDFLLLLSSPLWVLVLEGLVGFHGSVQLQLLQHYWAGHRLGLHDTEWFVSETNRDHSVIFEIAPPQMTCPTVTPQVE